MITRIEIISTIPDTRALVRKNKLHAAGFAENISGVTLVDVYTIDKKLSPTQLAAVAAVLANPVMQQVSFISPLSPETFAYVIEIGFLPGVTDNIGNTAQEIIADVLQESFAGQENVYYSQLTFLSGIMKLQDVEAIANSLYNPLIQVARIKSKIQFTKDKGMDKLVPIVKLSSESEVNTVDLKQDDEELMRIGKQGILNKDGTRRGPLALDLSYMKAIRNYFQTQKRNPTDIELESIAQTWSEHCKHTIFADPIDELKEGLYNTYIKAATEKIRKRKAKSPQPPLIKGVSEGRGISRDICVSVFTDNSGAIVFDDDYLITDKVETHNSPSALDPFGGSITGIVGVNRDAMGFGMGAKPVINRYGFCFGNPNDRAALYKGANQTQKMLSPRRIMDGVIDGVNAGGNCSGIPTPQGFMYFDDRYKGKPLVFVGTVGLIPRYIKSDVESSQFSVVGFQQTVDQSPVLQSDKQKTGKLQSENRKQRTDYRQPSYIKKALPGDYIVMVGGRVGQDGIHGATFSSEAMDSGSPATAVQIGDPITQKKMSDALVKEARDLGLFTSITDNGAGGLSCSVAEMAKEAGGSVVDLDAVPLKYPGLAPWQIWISESQERMTLSVPQKKWPIFFDLMQRRGVEATVIGKFTDSGKCVVKFKGETIMDVAMDFLHDGLPPRPMITNYVPKQHDEPVIKEKNDLSHTFLQMFSRLNISSNEFLSMQYDHEVQAGSVLKPLQGKGRVNADATVTRPLLSSPRAVVLSQSLYPRYSDIDTYHMAACAIDTAIRNAVAAGASLDHLALLDNFCWCSANDPFRLGQLKRAAKACYDYTVAYATPLISGKDSMFNDFKGYDEKGNSVLISIPPTLLISSIGVMKDATKAVSIDVKFPGDLIYLLGETYDELGGSEYYAMLGSVGNSVPKVDAKRNRKLYKALSRAIREGLIASAISVGIGGLGMALAKTAMAGGLGIEVSLKNIKGSVTRDDFALFSESQGRIVVSVDPKKKKEFETIMGKNAFALIGKVRSDDVISIKGLKKSEIVETKIGKAIKAYKGTFKEY